MVDGLVSYERMFVFLLKQFIISLSRGYRSLNPQIQLERENERGIV